MKNKSIKNPEELQRSVDYIIQLSDIVYYSENGEKREEENHLNVDLILAEPITVMKKRKAKMEKELAQIMESRREVSHTNHAHNLHSRENETPIPTMPRREKLIVHGEFYENKKVTIIDAIYFLFRPFSTGKR